MHKLFIDINVILDVALARELHLKSSQKILSHIERKKAAGYISAISCTTIYYLIQKESDPTKKALNYTRDILELLSVVEVNKKALERGFELETKDFEDSIQMACAEICQACGLQKFFHFCPISRRIFSNLYHLILSKIRKIRGQI
jgi:predicted nucleic acid-binding protein